VRAERFEIVGRDGKTRGIFGLSDDSDGINLFWSDQGDGAFHAMSDGDGDVSIFVGWEPVPPHGDTVELVAFTRDLDQRLRQLEMAVAVAGGAMRGIVDDEAGE
jgi:hypothetical protein